jgi:hypothetical protein
MSRVDREDECRSNSCITLNSVPTLRNSVEYVWHSGERCASQYASRYWQRALAVAHIAAGSPGHGKVFALDAACLQIPNRQASCRDSVLAKSTKHRQAMDEQAPSFVRIRSCIGPLRCRRSSVSGSSSFREIRYLHTSIQKSRSVAAP